MYSQIINRYSSELAATDAANLLELAKKWGTKRQFHDLIERDNSVRLMVIGGETDEKLEYSSMEYYCPRFKKWTYGKNLTDGRKNYATTVVENELFIIGGELNGQCLNTVRK